MFEPIIIVVVLIILMSIQYGYINYESYLYVIRKYLNCGSTYVVLLSMYIIFRSLYSGNQMFVDMMNGLFFGLLFVFLQNILKLNNTDIKYFIYENLKNETLIYDDDLSILLDAIDKIITKYDIDKNNLYEVKKFHLDEIKNVFNIKVQEKKNKNKNFESSLGIGLGKIALKKERY